MSLILQANTYSFERVVTLIAGYYFSSGHSILLFAYKLRVMFVCDVLLRLSARIKVSCLLTCLLQSSLPFMYVTTEWWKAECPASCSGTCILSLPLTTIGDA